MSTWTDITSDGGMDPRNAQPLCACKDRPLSECPGEWEQGCDLGANEKFVRVAPAQPAPDFTAFNPAEKCSPTLTQCPRCNNPHNACDGGTQPAPPEGMAVYQAIADNYAKGVQPAPEPVAWMMINPTHLPEMRSLHWQPKDDWHITWEAVPLYATPPSPQPLTQRVAELEAALRELVAIEDSATAFATLPIETRIQVANRKVEAIAAARAVLAAAQGEPT